MALYDRIIGRDDEGNVVPDRIVPEIFGAVLHEFARGKVTGAQAQEILGALRCPLAASEVSEAQTLLGTIQSQLLPVDKVVRYIEIERVLFLARQQAPGYARPTDVKARLGV